MANVARVTTALIVKLAADVVLRGYMPGGVWFNVAPDALTRYVVVSLIDATTDYELNGQITQKDCLYFVEARMQTIKGSPPPADIVAAADRIDALLNPQPPDPPATLPVSGYTLVDLTGESDVQETELDDANASVIWFRYGGHYRVQVAPIPLT
jgi:hypothetical protein